MQVVEHRGHVAGDVLHDMGVHDDVVARRLQLPEIRGEIESPNLLPGIPRRAEVNRVVSGAEHVAEDLGQVLLGSEVEESLT